MAAETTTYTPVKLFAGDFPPVLTAPGTLLDGEVLSQYELVETNAAGKLVEHLGFVDDATAATIDITAPVVGVMIQAASPSGADATVQIYTSGCFFAGQIVWPADATDDLLKAKLLEGSNIRVVFQDTGEV